MARVVVVGAGMAGLAVAARLATLGHDVVVCEQAETWGGKLGTFSRDGFTFDTGPSLLTLPDVYRDLFLATGRPLEESLDLVPVDPVARYRFPAAGGHDVTWLDLPDASPARLRAALDEALGAGAGADWERFLDRARDIWQVTRGPFLESPLTGAARPAAPGPAVVATCAPSRPGRRCAGSGSTLPARPAAADAARPLRDLHRVRPAPRARGAGRRPVRRADLRRLVRRAAGCAGSPTRWCSPRAEDVRRPAAHRCRRHRGPRRRAVGRGACGWPTASRCAADVVVANADAAHLYGDLLPDRRRRPAPGAGWTAARRRCPGSSCCWRCAAAPRRWRTTRCCSRPTTTRSSTRSSAGAPARPVDDPTVYVSAPDDPRCGPTTTTRPGSCW